MRLSELKIGEKAKIKAIKAESTIKSRLNALGILKGEEVEALKYTLAKGTYEVMVGSSRIALRKEEAESVEVTQWKR
jgi:Fe2+ transport system protein FeoA